MQEVRCPNCKKLLFKHGKRHIDLTGIDESIKQQIISQNINSGEEIEIKCDRCKSIIQVKFSLLDTWTW